MNKLLTKAFAKKIIELLLYGPGYKAPEYAYVRIAKTPEKNTYNNRFER